MKTELSSRRPASNTQLSIKQLFNVHDVIFTDEKHQLKRLAFELVTSVSPLALQLWSRFSHAKLILHHDMTNGKTVKTR